MGGVSFFCAIKTSRLQINFKRYLGPKKYEYDSEKAGYKFWVLIAFPSFSAYQPIVIL
jgi:hypothetical protein